LQDQNLNAFQNLKSDIHNAEDQVDFDLARMMIIEGDAMFNELLFSNDTAFLSGYRLYALDLEYLEGLPDFSEDFYLNYLVMAPYLIGPFYVGRQLRTTNDWNTVNDLFYNRALTVSQIITGREVEYRPFPSGYLKTLLGVQSYAFFDDSNPGLVNIYALLRGKISRSNAGQGLGWNGDHLIYVSNDYSRDGKFIWCFSFLSSAWADTVYPLLEANILERTSGPLPWSYVRDGSYSDSSITYRMFSNQSSVSSLVKHENEIYWIENLAEYETSLLDLLVKGEIPVVAKSAATGNQAFGKFLRKRGILKEIRSGVSSDNGEF
jgi:hypothetical protein